MVEYYYSIKRKNLVRLILAHVNIISIRYKFDQLVDGVKGKVDVLMITETKPDDSFRTSNSILKDTILLD